MDWKESLQKRQEVVKRASPIIETAERLYQEGMQEEGVLELGRTEDLLLRAVAETYRLPLPAQQPGQEATMLEILQAVETAGLLDEKDLKSLHELRQCRNSLAHASRNGCSLGQKAFLRIEEVLESTIPNLLCGLANGGRDRAISCMDDSLELIRRARQVAGKQAPEAAALRLGQALEIIVRASAGIVCPWVLVAREGESTLNDQINGLQQAGCYSEEEIRQLHAIQGLRNWAAHRQEQPMDGRAVEQAADWLEHFTLGPFARLLDVVEAYAKELKNREQQAKEKEQDLRTEEQLNTIRSRMENCGQVIFGMMVVFSAAGLVLSLVLVWTLSINGTAGVLQWVSMAGAVLCPVLWKLILLQAQGKAVRQGRKVQLRECYRKELLIRTGEMALCLLGGRYICVFYHEHEKYSVMVFISLLILAFIGILDALTYLHSAYNFVECNQSPTDMDRFGQIAAFALQVLLLVVFLVVASRPPFTPYW